MIRKRSWFTFLTSLLLSSFLLFFGSAAIVPHTDTGFGVAEAKPKPHHKQKANKQKKYSKKSKKNKSKKKNKKKAQKNKRKKNQKNHKAKKKETVKEKYRKLADQAIKQTKGNANPTVTRNGKDLFRVHKPNTGHGSKVTQIVLDGPPGKKIFRNARDVNVRARHVKKLEKALQGKGGYGLRLRNGKRIK